jgi:hypothetical protein
MYSDDLRSLVDSMLQLSPHKRPSVRSILALPFVQERLRKMAGADAPRAAPAAGGDVEEELDEYDDQGRRAAQLQRALRCSAPLFASPRLGRWWRRRRARSA